MPKVSYTVGNGRIVAETRNGVRKFYLPDPLGSTRALVDNTQTKTDTFTYWPYGEERTRTGSTPTPFRYVGTLGYYRDSVSRIYVRTRHFATGLGRWLTPDQMWPEEPAYKYARNDPVALADPSGSQSIRDESDWRAYARRQSSCLVRVCSLYGFGKPIVTHQYVCAVDMAGKTCSGGLYPGPRFGDEGMPCKDHVSEGTIIECHTVTRNCLIADKTCECLKFFRDHTPGWAASGMCWGFKTRVRECIEEILGGRFDSYVPNITGMPEYRPGTLPGNW